MILLRNFEPEDLFSVLKLANESLRESYDGGLFLQLGDLYPDGFIVAESGGEILGFILGVVERAYEARILVLAVHPRHRRRGLGRRLCLLFEERFAPKGIRKISLEVRVSNTAAIALYESLGYERKRVLPRYYADLEDAYLMVKVVR